MISVVAFDYGGVIEVSGSKLIDEIISYLDIERQNWFNLYFSLNHLCNTGENTWDEVVLLTVKTLGASDSQLEYVQSLVVKDRLSKVVNYELVNFIKELKSNFKIALISNYREELRGRLADQGLLDLFDEVIISGEVGYQKPQPEIFQLLCNKMKISASELVFIDDSKKSLEGADMIGYTPILYIDNQQLRKDLSLLLLQ